MPAETVDVLLREPASATARREDWAISAMAVLSGTRPQSDKAAPTMATRFDDIAHGYHIDVASDNDR